MNVYKTNNVINEKAQQLCEKLYLGAKKSRNRRFHQLYDKVYRMDVLRDSWEIVKRNKGCAGVDGVKIGDIVLSGQEEYLKELHETLLDTHKYHPRKIRRVYIPKSDGKKRPLGIPAIKDRIVQTATKILLEPIFEADFLNCSYGFRPNRNTHQALEEIRIWTNKGYKIVLDADIKGYFDNINHEKLLEFLSLRISDRKILKLIRKWLKCGIISEESMGENKVGTPQGGVISPLLANIYLHEFDKFWEHQTKVQGKLIRYADDFVIMFATKKDAVAGFELVKLKLEELNLELNDSKTTIVDMRDGKKGFDFLGYHNRQMMSWKYKKRFTLKFPTNKAMKNVKHKIAKVLGNRSNLKLSVEEIVKYLNPILRGWMNYFKYGNSAIKFEQIDCYVHNKMNLWWSKKHGKRGRNWTSGFTREKLLESGIQILSGNIKYWSTR